ncbi:MAG: carboxypeptidase regulatory-like domain-containing protein [Acidobacteria bacterium]|jgi:protocatechuate 3,4-dioxygenase beta subunit|nr:carboxypeptidase regulatory-like domain-containing protein [Acidobacteriota bacterium]
MKWTIFKKFIVWSILLLGTWNILVKTNAQSINRNTQAASGGFLSGRVTNESNNGIKGIYVDIYDLNHGSIASTYTNQAGNYSFDNLSEGIYKIHFRGSFKENYLGQWYPGVVSFDRAVPVVVTARVKTPDIDAELTPGGSISGHVTDYLGKNIQGIAIDIFDLNQSYIASTSTDRKGNYSLGGLTNGPYKIFFAGSFQLNAQNQWFNDKNSFMNADAVMVTVGQNTSDIDARLSQGGILSGRVTDDWDNALKNIVVDIYDLNYSYIDSAYTNKPGKYAFRGLPGGYYKIYFSAYRQNFFSEWYNNRLSFEMAYPVTVTMGQTTSDIDARLAVGGMMRGRVTDHAGNGIPGIMVELYDLNYADIASRFTNKRGFYALDGLHEGYYKLFFRAPKEDFFSEWYNDGVSFETAEEIALISGHTITINGELVPVGIISGRVIDALTGHGMEGIDIYAYEEHGNSINGSYTDEKGYYIMKNLHTGNYKIIFDTYYYNQVSQITYESQWYNDKNSRPTADNVEVMAGKITAGINAALSANHREKYP